MRSPPQRPLGSALLVTVILLAVLAVIGAAAVNLASRERINASAKGGRDRVYACANAARMIIWSEMSKYGAGPSAYFDATDLPTQVKLSDGTLLAAPAHYSTDFATAQVKNLVVKNTVGTFGAVQGRDLTNQFVPQGIGSGKAYTIIATCTYGKTELEVEFTTGLAL